MNIFELLFLFLALFLSYLFGRFFVGQIGWWGVLPAVILGFGSAVGLLIVLSKFDAPDRGKKQKADSVDSSRTKGTSKPEEKGKRAGSPQELPPGAPIDPDVPN